MDNRFVCSTRPYAWVALGFLLFMAGELHGQVIPPPVGRTFESGMRTGIGYTPVIPDVMGGVGVWRVTGPWGLGAFAESKVTVPGIEGHRWYCPPELQECRVGWVETRRNDVVMQDIDEYLLFNAGVMKVLTPEFAVLLGGGMVRRSMYREYFHDEEDQILRITDSGGYYVPFDDLSSWGGQLVVGALLRLGQNLVVRFGYETGPGGMSLGGYWVFPW
jgi:hypothetical protein